MWQPPELRTMKDMACQMHEYYLSLRDSGFDRHEALHLIQGQSTCLCEGDGNGQKPPTDAG